MVGCLLGEKETMHVFPQPLVGSAFSVSAPAVLLLPLRLPCPLAEFVSSSAIVFLIIIILIFSIVIGGSGVAGVAGGIL